MNQMPEPYLSAPDLPFDPHGWFYNQKPLEECLQNKPKTVIEIGSWLGASTRFIAERLSSGGKLYAIDTWKGSLDEEQHREDPRLAHIYPLFLSNVKHAKLTHVIIPVRMESLEAARQLNIKADLIYIDGAHDTQSVYADIMAWYDHLNPGGILCGDDIQWSSVRDAVVLAAIALKQTIEAEGNFWKFCSEET
jgi:predicted O-methyltransferase YrrM